MEDAAGWKVIINVPQPNGKDGQHIWVAAISDEEEVRKRLLLRQIPCEAQLEPLSVHELRQLGVDPGEVRRVLATTAATPTVEIITDHTGHSTRQVNDDVSLAPTEFSGSGSESGQAAEGWSNDSDQASKGDADQLQTPLHKASASPADQPQSDDRRWRRLGFAKHKT